MFAIGIMGLPLTQNIIMMIANIKYVGIFIAGVFFTYSTTTIPALAIFARASQLMNPYLLITIGAFGAMLGDIIIFKYVEKLAIKEIKKVTRYIKKKQIFDKVKITVPIVMFIVLSTPLPDEIAAGLAKIPNYSITKFAAISFVSKLVGISVIFWIANII
jgi:hypothetical protein